jgi:hypothetical protein
MTPSTKHMPLPSELCKIVDKYAIKKDNTKEIIDVLYQTIGHKCMNCTRDIVGQFNICISCHLPVCCDKYPNVCGLPICQLCILRDGECPACTHIFESIGQFCDRTDDNKFIVKYVDDLLELNVNDYTFALDILYHIKQDQNIAKKYVEYITELFDHDDTPQQ